MAEQYSGVLDPIGGEDRGNGEPPIVNPADHHRDGTGGADDSGDGAGIGTRTRKRRSDAGKPRGSRSGTGSARSSTKATLDIDGVSALLVLIHKALAERSGVRDENGILIWEISSAEGNALAQAANNVIRHYDIAASQKMIDWGAAVTTALAVYAPRLAATVEARDRSIPHAQAA